MKVMLPDLNSPLEQLMDFSTVDVIITDLDGTLVQHGTKILGQLQGIQQKLNGVMVTIATGRTYAGAKSIADEMRIKKGTPITLYNGAVVLSYQTNTILYRKTIANSVLKELCKLLDLKSQYLLAYYLMPGEESDIVETVHGFGAGSLNRDFNNMEIIWHGNDHFDELGYTSFKTTNGSKEGYIRSTVGRSLFHQTFEPCSILIDKKVVADRTDLLANYLESCPLISCTDSGGGFWEIRAKDVSKGIIFQYIDHEKKCIAIGDNDNDIELLRGADIGIAVANGSAAAKRAAQYQCRREGTSGVLELIRTIREAKRYR